MVGESVNINVCDKGTQKKTQKMMAYGGEKAGKISVLFLGYCTPLISEDLYCK